MQVMRSLALFVMLAMPPLLNAEMTVKDYREKRSDRIVGEMVKFYVQGLGDGMSWADIVNKLRSANGRAGAPLYCAPEKLALTRENYLDILDAGIERALDHQTKAEVEKQPIGPILLNSLMETFPCKTKP